MPPFAYVISGSVVALITLRKGAVTGLQTMIVSLLLLELFSFVAGLSLQLSLAYAGIIWLPVWLASSVLRLTEHQGLMLAATGLMTMALIIAVYMIVGDVPEWWKQWLDLMLEKAVPANQIDQYREVLTPAVSMLNAMMAAGLTLNIFMSVLFARWWQSTIFNPGAFQKEFYALSLPSIALVFSAVVMVLVFILAEPWRNMFRDILVVMMFLYLIQGISSVHRSVAKYKLSAAWLVSMYCLLLLLPQMGLFIACLGMTDTYFQWRRKKTGLENES